MVLKQRLWHFVLRDKRTQSRAVHIRYNRQSGDSVASHFPHGKSLSYLRASVGMLLVLQIMLIDVCVANGGMEFPLCA